mmetsp:Transcript_26907/g.67642  ORF Transcript_26907/g.67642 Transcript_26907/m.67642 type:complete len:131 (+) Transcript_26907:368-760(+)
MTTSLEASSALTEQDRATLRDAILRASRHTVSWERSQFERKTLIRKQLSFSLVVSLILFRGLSHSLSQALVVSLWFFLARSLSRAFSLSPPVIHVCSLILSSFFKQKIPVHLTSTTSPELVSLSLSLFAL